jgi:hypothetical protein
MHKRFCRRAGLRQFVSATRGVEAGVIKVLPRLSQRTYDLMRRALDAMDGDPAALITMMVAAGSCTEKQCWGRGLAGHETEEVVRRSGC